MRQVDMHDRCEAFSSRPFCEGRELTDTRSGAQRGCGGRTRPQTAGRLQAAGRARQGGKVAVCLQPLRQHQVHTTAQAGNAAYTDRCPPVLHTTTQRHTRGCAHMPHATTLRLTRWRPLISSATAVVPLIVSSCSLLPGTTTHKAPQPNHTSYPALAERQGPKIAGWCSCCSRDE